MVNVLPAEKANTRLQLDRERVHYASLERTARTLAMLINVPCVLRTLKRQQRDPYPVMRASVTKVTPGTRALSSLGAYRVVQAAISKQLEIKSVGHVQRVSTQPLSAQFLLTSVLLAPTLPRRLQEVVLCSNVRACQGMLEPAHARSVLPTNIALEEVNRWIALNTQHLALELLP